MNHARRGAVFLEACVAMLVVAATFVAISRLMVVSARQRLHLEQKSQAMSIAANAMEQLMARSGDDLTQEKLTARQSTLTAGNLPDGVLEVDVIEHTDPVAREIRVRVQWRRSVGQTGLPIQLTAWRFD